MDRFLTKQEQERLWEEKDKHKVKCKCGHINIIWNPKGYKICSWCKNYVFENPKLEFEFRLNQQKLKEKRN